MSEQTQSHYASNRKFIRTLHVRNCSHAFLSRTRSDCTKSKAALIFACTVRGLSIYIGEPEIFHFRNQMLTVSNAYRIQLRKSNEAPSTAQYICELYIRKIDEDHVVGIKCVLCSNSQNRCRCQNIDIIIEHIGICTEKKTTLCVSAVGCSFILGMPLPSPPSPSPPTTTHFRQTKRVYARAARK